MSTDTLCPSSVTFASLLMSLMLTLAQSQICFVERTNLVGIMKNGHPENVPVKTMAKECCTGYIVDKNNPQLCVSICQEGFVHERGTCIPRCDNCENGECLAPGECKCNEGYTESQGGCAPICDECINAICVKPGVCECKEDFVSTTHGCVPKCEGCANGFCLKPGECQCAAGYKMSIRDFKCKPRCKKRCENGFCSAPNECTCHQGYRKLTLNPNVCVPKTAREVDDDDGGDGDDGDDNDGEGDEDDVDFAIDDHNTDVDNKAVERKVRKIFNIPAKKSFLLVILKIL